jgi:hypothetical protein
LWEVNRPINIVMCGVVVIYFNLLTHFCLSRPPIFICTEVRLMKLYI